MKRFLFTALLVLGVCFGAHAQLNEDIPVPQPATSYLKMKVNGKTMELRGDALKVEYHNGDKKEGYSSAVTLNTGDTAKVRPILIFYTLPDKMVTAGKYPFISPEPPYAHIHMEQNNLDKFSLFSLDDNSADAVEVASVEGKVATGRFKALLINDEDKSKWNVTEGTFQFTLP